MLAQVPGIGFAGCQASAMDARLLARAIADDLAIGDPADRVGLGVFAGTDVQEHVF